MDAGPRIAIDAMGGDTGPAAIVAGIAGRLRRDSSLRFLLFGDEKIVREELKRHDRLADEVTVHHGSSLYSGLVLIFSSLHAGAPTERVADLTWMRSTFPP